MWSLFQDFKYQPSVVEISMLVVKLSNVASSGSKPPGVCNAQVQKALASLELKVHLLKIDPTRIPEHEARFILASLGSQVRFQLEFLRTRICACASLMVAAVTQMCKMCIYHTEYQRRQVWRVMQYRNRKRGAGKTDYRLAAPSKAYPSVRTETPSVAWTSQLRSLAAYQAMRTFGGRKATAQPSLMRTWEAQEASVMTPMAAEKKQQVYDYSATKQKGNFFFGRRRATQRNRNIASIQAAVTTRNVRLGPLGSQEPGIRSETEQDGGTIAKTTSVSMEVLRDAKQGTTKTKESLTAAEARDAERTDQLVRDRKIRISVFKDVGSREIGKTNQKKVEPALGPVGEAPRRAG
jgi:hypothetical protein